jgi:hypothetical protein
VTNNTVKLAQSDMEMFWLSKPKMKMNKIFPRDLGEKVFIQFCCRGQECKRDPDIVCSFLHPCSSEDINWKPLNPLEITSWQRRLVGLTNITLPWPKA